MSSDGHLFVSGNLHNRVYDGGFAGLKSEFTEYPFKGLKDGERIVSVAVFDDQNLIAVTSEGNVFGYGYETLLGTGTGSLSYRPLEKLGIDHAIDVTFGNDFAIITKDDGTVWGTGSNATGVLGRWIDGNSGKTSNRYKTAIKWVECVDLEY